VTYISVEQFIIAELVAEGSPRKAFLSNISVDDFDIYDEEFGWVISQAELGKPINVRLFKKKFPDFEFIRPRERIQDLCEELKDERAYVTIRSAIEEIERELDHDNAIEKASQLKEILSEVVKRNSPANDVLIKANWKGHIKEQKEILILRQQGQTVGMPTGLKNLDYYWGGLQPGKLYCILGRPGDAKSFTLAKFATEAMLDGRRVGFFSPEFNEREHRCRFSTLLSANEMIQRECKLNSAFKNRALMDGKGYNLKKYQKFLEYCESEIKGEICLFTQKYRRERMTPSYIESKIEDRGLELIIIDPIYKLHPGAKFALRHEKIEALIDYTQNISKGFNIPVVVSNQATRSLVGNRGEAPTKDTSFGSDAPAQESDYVLGVKHFSDEHMMKLDCSKSRFGESFKFKVKFWPNIGKMEDITIIKGEFDNGYDAEKAEEVRKLLKEDAEDE